MSVLSICKLFYLGLSTVLLCEILYIWQLFFLVKNCCQRLFCVKYIWQLFFLVKNSCQRFFYAKFIWQLFFFVKNTSLLFSLVKSSDSCSSWSRTLVNCILGAYDKIYFLGNKSIRNYIGQLINIMYILMEYIYSFFLGKVHFPVEEDKVDLLLSMTCSCCFSWKSL